ncbi:DUF11 domain-containing protein [Brevibacterium luteolum]|uniref:DUF7507 domain-containing protein n=1 Tax=Brevibacterium luteolum TaxID=199591 RepID=UPI001C234DE1|nr:DUF11 domain-containing protein [Brevibacterium luteolum]MBU8579246.1 DUF11 domain-containing protein [Brevibacterium luteolum]
MWRQAAHTPVFKTVAGALALALAVGLGVVAGVIVPVGEAEAKPITPMSQRYNATVNGDFLMVGNGALECDKTKPTWRTDANCTGLHGGSASNSPNDYLWMKNSDNGGADMGANSSSASVTVPAGAKVVKAQLYWSGNTGYVNGVAGVRCTANARGTLPNWVASEGSPQSTRPRISVAGSAPASVDVGRYTQESNADLGSNGIQYYSASADVTAQFANVPTGSAQTVTVGNLWSVQGYGCYTGWSLAVVYDFGTFVPGNAAAAARTVILYDGHVRKQPGEQSENVTFDGFTAQGPGARAGFTLYEGDRSIDGDTATYRTSSSATQREIPNSYGETGNIGVSRAVGSQSYREYTGSNPFVNANVDVVNTPLSGVTQGDTSATVSLSTRGDSYLLQNTIFSVPTGAVRIDKSYNGTDDTQTIKQGERPSYTITVTNSGSVALNNVRVEDPAAPECSRTLGSLPAPTARGYTQTFTCKGPATTEPLENTATVKATTPDAATLQSSDSTKVETAGILVTKIADPTVVPAGEDVTWTVAVTNSGSVPLENVAIEDTVLDACDQSGITLEAKETREFTCSGPVTGVTSNTVTATGEAGSHTVSDEATAAATAIALRLQKQVGTYTDTDGSGTQNAGDTLEYTFKLTNTGSAPLTNLSVSDPKIGTITCPSDTTLAVGASVDCTPATYTLTQEDIDAGKVENTATAEATDPQRIATATDESSATAEISALSSIYLAKSASQITAPDGSPRDPADVQAGDQLTYSFTVTNTGSSTLRDVQLSDTKLGISNLACPIPGGTLTPGDSVECPSQTYTLTQSDLDNEELTNSAAATAQPPRGDRVSNDSGITVPIGADAGALQLTKRITGGTDVDNNGLSAGDLVSYAFTVTNTGHVTLHDIDISDPTADGDITCEATQLAPGESTNCTGATHTLTQDEIDAGSLTNEATVTGVTSQGNEVSDDDSVTGTLTPASGIKLTKTVGDIPSDADAGTEVEYTFTIENTGATTLRNVTLEDNRLDDPATCSPDTTTLQPGDTLTCTGTHALTQAEVDAGVVSNDAEATGTPDNGDPVSSDDHASAVIPTDPSMSAMKTAGDIADANNNGIVDAGDTVDFSITVRNTSTVTLTDLRVEDALISDQPLDCGTTTIAPLDEVVCGPFTYEITQADIDAGIILNTADVEVTAPGGENLIEDPAVTVPVERKPDLTVNKTASDLRDLDGNGPDPGDALDYSFTVTNTGNTTLTDIELTDHILGGKLSCGTEFPASLTPGASATCGPFEYFLSQDDVDGEGVRNTVTVTGDGQGTPVEDDDEVLTPITGAKTALSLEKTGEHTDVNGNGLIDAGDTVAYTFEVRNTGAITITDLALNDPRLGGAIDCPEEVLASGSRMACTGTSLTITQEDIDSGSVDNTATVTGKPSNGADEVSAEDSFTLPVSGQPSFTLEKTAADGEDRDGSGTASAGDTIDFSFTVTNTGTVTISDLTIDDPLLDEVTCDPSAVAPGESVTCTAAPYVLTQADVDAGEVTNTATLTGNGPQDSDPEPVTDSVTVPLLGAPDISLVKSGGRPIDENGSEVGQDTSNPAQEGDRIPYTFEVTNTGNVTLTDLVLTDDTISSDPISCEADSLAPGASTTCGPVHYTLTQHDANARHVVNSATVVGTAPDGEKPEATDSVDTSFSGRAALTLIKGNNGVNDLDGNNYDAGDTIDWTFTVQNTGTQTVSDIRIDDELLAGSTITCESTELDPGDQTECVVDQAYELTQADIDAGIVVNEAVARGTFDGSDIVSPEVESTVRFTGYGGFEFAKTAGEVVDANGSGRTDVGDTVTYGFHLTNTGNTTLTSALLTDELIGPEPLACPLPDGGLAPGASVDCPEETYTLTQSDIDAGEVTNRATLSVDGPGRVPGDETDEITTELDSATEVTLEKSVTEPVDANGDGRVSAGDQVEYSFELTNTGVTTLTRATLTDDKLGLDGVACALPDAGLAPGEKASCDSVTYTLTQADIDAGKVTNTATITITDTSGTTASDEDDAERTFTAETALNLEKRAGAVTDANDNGRIDAGDTIDYTFTITNTGATTLDAISLDDPLLGGDVSCPALPDEGLAPGESLECGPHTYTITQDDVDAGEVTNTATAGGEREAGDNPPDATDETRTPIDGSASLAVTKTAGDIVDANGSGKVDAGDTIEYTVAVENTGILTVRDVTVTDPLLGGEMTDCSPAAPATLQPGDDPLTCTGTYTLTAADLDRGSVENTAKATGTSGPDDAPVEDETTITTPVDGSAAVALSKTAGAVEDTNGSGRIDAGDQVSYTFTITNTGDVGLRSATLTDPKLGLDGHDCQLADTLEPGESAECQAPAYTLTQEDIDAGTVENTATADAVDTRDRTVSADDSADVTFDREGGVELKKEAGEVTDVDGDGIGAGDTISYTFTVTNTGTTTLTDIAVTDPLLEGTEVTCAQTALAPGESTQCGPVDYELTQADADAGEVTNSANVTGKRPDGETETDEDSITTPVPAEKSVKLEKHAEGPKDTNGSGKADAGDTIEYSFTVTNDGHVTLTEIVIDDPLLGGEMACDIGTLAPGESAECGPYPYTITEEDVERGEVTNDATVIGLPDDGDDDGRDDDGGDDDGRDDDGGDDDGRDNDDGDDDGEDNDRDDDKRDDHDKPKPPPTEDDDSNTIETDKLPRTGTEIAAMAILAALLIGSGVTVVLVIRRHRRS